MEPEIKPSLSARISALLRRLRGILASFWVNAVSLFSKLRTPIQKTWDAIRPKDNTDNERTDPQSQRAYPVIPKSDPPPPPPDEKKSRKRCHNGLQIATFVVELFALFGLGVYAFLTYLMYCETKKAADAAHDSAIAAKKAADTAEGSFKVEKRRAEDMEAAILQINGGGTAAKDNSFPVTVTNLGKFTARGVELHIEVSLNSVPHNKIIRVLVKKDLSTPEIAGQKNWIEKLELPLSSNDWENIADTKEMIVQLSQFKYENGFERKVTDSRCQMWAYFRTPQDTNNPVSGRGNDCKDFFNLLDSIRREQKH